MAKKSQDGTSRQTLQNRLLTLGEELTNLGFTLTARGVLKEYNLGNRDDLLKHLLPRYIAF